MEAIWYLLKCPEGNEADYAEKCWRLAGPGELQEVVYFRYQRMLRYGGAWHVENRVLLPGRIFVSASEPVKWAEDKAFYPIPCKVAALKALCTEKNVVGMSRGILKNGTPIVTYGPLKGQERLIRRIDRHKRTAQIQLLLAGRKERAVVGLEIYEKQDS